MEATKRKKIIRTSTVPLSLDLFCRGHLSELSKEYEVIALSSPGKELENVREREKVRTIEVKMSRTIAPLKDLAALVRLVGVLRREKPQMVHSMTPKAGLLSMIAARLCRVPVRLHTFTGLLFPSAKGLSRRLFMLTDRLTCLCATNLMAEGKGVRDDLIGNRITKKQVVVLGNGNVRGVDLDYYNRSSQVENAARDVRKRFSISQDDFVFVFVGRPMRDKGINELVNAFCRLQGEASGVHLLIVGEDETKKLDLKAETIEAIDKNPYIHHAPWQEDVRPWYAASDALAFPSYREGFPNTVLEAGALGLPSIVTDINGSREIIEDKENGLIVPARNTEALYGAMKRLSLNQDEAKLYGANARERVAARYERGFVFSCLKKYYQSLLQ